MTYNYPTREQIKNKTFTLDDNSCVIDTSCYVRAFTMRYADLSNRNVSSSYFYSVDMRGAGLNNSKAVRLEIEHSKADGVDFTNADMTSFSSRRTSFRNARFHGATLAHSRFEWCDMRGADFQDACLPHCSFIDTDLREASFSCAGIGNANLLGAKGVLCLPMHDPRGYRPLAVAYRVGWLIFSGCRMFNVEGAKDHWGKHYMGQRDIGDGYLRALDWLENQPLPSFDDWSEPEIPEREDSK